jgi:hypothetical protein
MLATSHLAGARTAREGRRLIVRLARTRAVARVGLSHTVSLALPHAVPEGELQESTLSLQMF